MNCVLIVANDFTTIKQFRMELLSRLMEDKYKVVIALPKDERNDEFTALGCTVVDIPLQRFGTNPLADLKIVMSIKRIISEYNPVMVFNYTAKPNIYGGFACSLSHTPYVCTVTGLGSNFDKGNLISKIMLLLQKVAYMKAQRVFFQNESNASFFWSHGIAKDNSDIIPGSGVNLEENRFEPYPDNPIIKFIAIARIREDKGYNELFEAIQECHTNSIPAQFCVVGWYEEDKYKPVVEKMRAEYGVEFFENVPHENIHNVLSQYDCLIQPSHHEGMSNVILEAAAAGRPCIVSDINGCKEGVLDGESGYLFTVKDAKSLFERICEMAALVCDKRAQMGLEGRKHMEHKFDRKLVIQKYVDEIEKAVERVTQ